MVLAQSAAAGDSARIFSRTLGGSMGTTAISSVATDSSGNVIVAGTTSSFDFPVTNGSVNSGTAIAESFDAGKTWKPLGNQPAGSTYVLARDASIPPLLFAGGRGGVFRSYENVGASWKLISTRGNSYGQIVVDPFQPLHVFAGAESRDGGVTWSQPSLSRMVTQMLFDPHVAGHIWAATNPTSDGFVAKLDPSGNQILFATYLGGKGVITFRRWDWTRRGTFTYSASPAAAISR
jgi:Beta-propeller repeat